MSLASGTIQTIQGATLAECKRKLQEMYGDDFEIKNRESVFKSCGFLGLKQKEVQVVSYVVNQKSLRQFIILRLQPRVGRRKIRKKQTGNSSGSKCYIS